MLGILLPGKLKDLRLSADWAASQSSRSTNAVAPENASASAAGLRWAFSKLAKTKRSSSRRGQLWVGDGGHSRLNRLLISPKTPAWLERYRPAISAISVVQSPFFRGSGAPIFDPFPKVVDDRGGEAPLGRHLEILIADGVIDQARFKIARNKPPAHYCRQGALAAHCPDAAHLWHCRSCSSGKL
jgi:hypothetical protein